MDTINKEVKVAGLTISNENQTGCTLSFAVHQVKGEGSLIGDLQRVHKHLNDAGRLVKLHCVLLEDQIKPNPSVARSGHAGGQHETY